METRSHSFRASWLRSLTGPGLCLSALLGAGFLGCMAEPEGPKAPLIDDPLPLDDRLSGTSSTTNWPEENQGCDDDYRIVQRSDSGLTLQFWITENNTPVLVKLTGVLTFYKGGVIPVFDSVPAVRRQFIETDSLEVPLDSLHGHIGSGGDDVTFSIRIESTREGEKVEAILIGYVYSFSEKRFLRTPQSASPNISYFLRKPAYSLRGPVDALLNSLPTVKGNPKFSFYIPGSPYHWSRTMNDIVELGPIPRNDGYPMRLLRMTEGEGPNGEALLETFEVQFGSEKKVTLENGVYHELYLRMIQPLWSGHKSSALTLRDTVPAMRVGGKYCF